MSDAKVDVVTILSLPPDELAAVLQNLSLEDITNLACSCRAMHFACEDDRVWFAMCEATWAAVTDVRQWIVPVADRPPPSPASPSPGKAATPFATNASSHASTGPATFKELFHLLRNLEGLCGCLWRIIGEGPVGGLVQFSWTDNGVVGEKLEWSSLQHNAERSAYHGICPRRGLAVGVEWENEEGNKVTLRAVQRHGGSGSIRRSLSAESAAAVALGTPQNAIAVLGASPKGSFEFAWLEFMSGNVAKPRAKLRRKSSGKGGSAAPPELHHLRRVVAPRPTPRHPLAGMYVGDYYGPSGMQVVSVAYDFSGQAARIVADKVVGDVGVAAGQRTWWALAAAVEQPWSTAEAALVEALQQRRQEDGMDALEMLFLEDEGAGGGGARQEPGWEVAAVHVGAGQVAAGVDQPREWVEGRLWVLGDGTLMFWWLEGLFQEAQFKKIDADLEVPARRGRQQRLTTATST